MLSNLKKMLCFCGVCSLLPAEIYAGEILVGQNQNTNMLVRVYNNNLGLVHDTRKVSLEKGLNEVAFEGVASSIQPESAILNGAGIQVLEQNYDYNLLTAENLLNSSVGKEVKTAVQNPQNGQMIMDKATLVSSNYGNPILRFDYGIEAHFPGRIIYDALPQNLRVKPTLVASLESSKAGVDNLELTYLTYGLSWKADYVAQIVSEQELNLNTWITLKNETGTDYDNAQVELISGSVNLVNEPTTRVYPMLAMKAERAGNAVADAVTASGVAPQNVADYYMYKLPRKTTIKDKQSKQISLMHFDKVKYEKEYRFQSPLYLGAGASQSAFEKKHPDIVFKLTNSKENRLGQPLPAGMMRFYQNKDGEDMVFLGENRIEQTAVGEKAELRIGQAFDLWADGKIVDAKAIAKDIYEYQVAVTFKNVSDFDAKVVFEQNLYNNWNILQESIKSVRKNASVAKWQFDLAAQKSLVLNFTVRVNRNI